jgi:hypothetical protein
MITVLRTLARRLRAAIAECNYAQRRITVLQANPDGFLIAPGKAPDTYREFLLRSAGPLEHEPSAADRARRHHVG